jgi:hypothetical protein
VQQPILSPYRVAICRSIGPGTRRHGSRAVLLAIGIAAAGCGASSPSESASVDGASAEGPTSDSGGEERVEGTDATSAESQEASSRGDASVDASSPRESLDAHADALRTADANPVGTDAASGCSPSCPAGQITVNWSQSSPGFPGPSGCECAPNPCDGGAASCSAYSACQALAHLGGCDNWNNGTLGCFQCG